MRTVLVTATVLVAGLAAPTAALADQTPRHGAAGVHTTSAAPAHAALTSAHRKGDRRATSKIPFTSARVTDNGDGSYSLQWTAQRTRKVVVRAAGRVVAQGGGSGHATVRGLPAADRQWFDFTPGKGEPLRLADRRIALQGAVNFRDAGGYRTADGHWVKMGEVYRSGALDQLTDADLRKLRRLGIKLDIDLRTDEERATAPDRLPAGTRYTVANVMGASTSGYEQPKSAEESVRMMVDGEKAMVSSELARSAYTKLVSDVSDGRNHAVLFHCSAGKDRTGWANAVLLTALGVPRSTVTSDYLASNTYRAQANADALAALPPAQAAVMKPMLDVRTEYLNSGFAEVKATYGTFDKYLKSALGFDASDLARFRKQMLVG
ncbi:tyrosine-protein phosphatase [Streptomyces sp. NPDC049954]|uniref:tyrosine-protein phosphatase n=1 Tax=Streptomyces sp. NPDC049954 TaxID=3155779 RepID=UPI003418E483